MLLTDGTLDMNRDLVVAGAGVKNRLLYAILVRENTISRFDFQINLGRRLDVDV
jgi:hypothetical protein